MKRILVLGILAVTGVLSISLVGAQQQQGPPVIDVEKLKDNMFVLKGGGGNTGVFIGSNGVVVVDAKNPGWGQAILDKIKTLTDKPVTTLINTHTHADHVSGNDRVELYYFGRGHTNGDAWVLFPALRILHAGDIFSGKNIPLLDANNGGSAVAIPDSLQKAYDTLKNVDTIITGHSTQATMADLKEYAQFNREFLADVQAAKKAGKSVDTVANTWKIPAKYAGYAAPAANRLKNNVQLAYSELK